MGQDRIRKSLSAAPISLPVRRGLPRHLLQKIGLDEATAGLNAESGLVGCSRAIGGPDELFDLTGYSDYFPLLSIIFSIVRLLRSIFRGMPGGGIVHLCHGVTLPMPWHTWHFQPSNTSHLNPAESRRAWCSSLVAVPTPRHELQVTTGERARTNPMQATANTEEIKTRMNSDRSRGESSIQVNYTRCGDEG